MGMKASAKKIEQAPEHKPPREINAKFKSRLPILVEELCQSLLVLEPVIDQMTVPLKEFLDHLDFEIQRIDLDIKTKRWESVVDVEAIKADEAWLQQLRQLRADFNIEAMTAPLALTDKMISKVRDMFGMRRY
jgi:hypothetical protein